MNTHDDIFRPWQLGAHTVPGIWRYMLPEDVLYFRPDPESRATCFDCPEVKAHGFHPDIRCCTYLPRIPNFLLGFGLMDRDTRERAEAFIDAGQVIPEGSQLAPGQLERSLLWLSGRLPQGSVQCPFLDRPSRRCGFYAYRNGVCSTFFCQHDQGSVGAEFWEQLGDLVTQVETALSHWALGEVGFDVAAYFQRFEALVAPGSQEAAWPEEMRRVLFGEWFGLEKELFRRCADAVIQNKQQLFAIAGQQRLRQTQQYDARLREHFAPHFSAHLIAEHLPEGEPMSIPAIWYGLQLAHRNLQMNRLSR